MGDMGDMAPELREADLVVRSLQEVGAVRLGLLVERRGDVLLEQRHLRRVAPPDLLDNNNNNNNNNDDNNNDRPSRPA